MINDLFAEKITPPKPGEVCDLTHKFATPGTITLPKIHQKSPLLRWLFSFLEPYVFRKFILEA
ncbi:MAG: hypothetical protein APF76_18230 [Desulfitibacter sp. BRH_c19]|nr:MAG: hypothetical protein APF76_18230 [Desulfitibacter sp. BRH_c19]